MAMDHGFIRGARQSDCQVSPGPEKIKRQVHHGGAACDQYSSSNYRLVCGNGLAPEPVALGKCVAFLWNPDLVLGATSSNA